MGWWRRVWWSLALLVPVGSALAGLLWWVNQPTPRPPDVIFVVVDTLRADRTHLCGNDRPTTPVLDRLASEPGWNHVCDAVSPASWTIPSHLALFTGRSYLEVREAGDAPVRTLADEFTARGYDTALVSANMVLRKDDRFLQGFRQTRTAKTMAEMKGKRFLPAVEEILDAVDPRRPLFLYVNIIDVHSPYLAVPASLGWIPSQPGVQTRRYGKDADSPFARYMSGKMPPEERLAYAETLTNGYDYGVHLADRNLGELMETLRSRHRLDNARIVVTSDHGDLLGEHDVIGHGDTLYEPGLRVPFLYRDTSRSSFAVPPGLSVLQAHNLLLNGELKPSPADRYVTNHVFQFDEAWTAVALWPEGGGKLLWRDGESFRFDLATDPQESNPLPLGDHRDAQILAALVERVRAIDGSAMDDDTRELLEAAGYLEADSPPSKKQRAEDE